MEPVKLKYVKKIRGMADSVLLNLPLARINPNAVSGASVLASLLFILTLDYPAIAFFFIIATLLLDLLDGAIARKYGMASEEGYMADAMSDRLSEGIMFIPFFMPWFYLFAINAALTILSFAAKRHIILPLRHVFMVYYFFLAVI